MKETRQFRDCVLSWLWWDVRVSKYIYFIRLCNYKQCVGSGWVWGKVWVVGEWVREGGVGEWVEVWDLVLGLIFIVLSLGIFWWLFGFYERFRNVRRRTFFPHVSGDPFWL